METNVVTYPVPEGAPRSSVFEVHAAGQDTGVYATGKHSFAIFSFSGDRVDVSIQLRSYVRDVVVRPRSAGIHPDIHGHLITFSLDRPRKLSVEVNGDKNLFLFADALEVTPPDPRDTNVITYGPGYHDLKKETLSLESGQTLYIAGGAYLDNGKALLIDGARDVAVRGRGVLVAPTRVFQSHDIVFEGIILNPNYRTWMNKIDASQYVTYRNIKVLAGDDTVVNYDGFDVMSDCHHVHVDDAFVRANDDILSVKHHPHSPGYWSSKAGISHVSVTNTVAWNLKGGSICRIGPESIGPYIEHIRMQNIDVIHNQAGGVFEIRTVDGTRIEDIVFEDWRIEEDHQPLLRFDMKEWYRIGDGRGTVRRVFFRNIKVKNGPGEGTLAGEDKDHTFSELYFDDVSIDGSTVASLSDLGVEDPSTGEVFFDLGVIPDEDREAPGIESVDAFATGSDRSATVVYVTFTEPVTRASAESADRYTLGDSGGIHSAHVAPGFRHVILITDPLAAGAEHTITVDGVCDLSGNAISTPVSRSFQVLSGWCASRDYGSWQGLRGWHYEQFNPEDVQVYASREDIVQSPTYWLMNARAEPEGIVWRAHRRDAWISDSGQQAGAAYSSIRSWMAPVQGKVLLSGLPALPTDAGSHPVCRIVHGQGGTPDPKSDSELWSSDAAPPAEDRSITCDVDDGDVIRFIADASDGAADVSIAWDPRIQYIT